MRKSFDKQLALLNVELTVMGKLCIDAISQSLEILSTQDNKTIKKIFSLHDEIDSKEHEVERLAMQLLLKQQPVATDLRIISAALRMIADMERIGDQAYDIADITKHMESGDELLCKDDLRDMAATTVLMVTKSVDSFVSNDVEMAKEVIDQDDIVDDLFHKIRQDLVSEISNKSEMGDIGLNTLMIAKYLERIGDHATNIAEWVIFSVTGDKES